MGKGFFIALDGIDGCGSTTHTGILKKNLELMKNTVYVTREPSQFGAGILLREYLKKKNIPSPTDALLFAADRVEHYYNEIQPNLNHGNIVLSDRYLESSIAYQSAQTDDNFEITIEWIETINKFVPKPDITIILDIEPEISLKRKYSEEDDIEKFENSVFLEKVRRIYIERAELFNYPIIDVNRSKDLVSDEIKMLVMKKLNIK